MTAITTVDVEPILSEMVNVDVDVHDELTDMDGGYACAYSEDGDPAVTTYNGTNVNEVYETSRDKKNFGHGRSAGDTSASNFHTVFRKKSAHDRAVSVKFFTTRHTPGSWIRNAITGDMEHVRVGSIEEHQYFKIGLSTGELGTDAYGKHLYYDSPEQYERHFGYSLSPELVVKWYAKAHHYEQIQAQAFAQSQSNTIVR